MGSLSYKHNLQWYNGTMIKKKQQCTETEFAVYVLPICYWLTASIMVILKVLGYSSLTWFWTLIPITWPFILSFGFFAVVAIIMISVLIISVIIFGCIEIYETITKTLRR
jgi:hypothetical protein